MPRFTSPYRSLALQGDGDAAPYAQFVDGAFETDDEAVAERLRAVADGSVTEDVEQDEQPGGEVPSPAPRGRRRAASGDGSSDSSASQSSAGAGDVDGGAGA